MTRARRTILRVTGAATFALLSAACGAGKDVGPGPAVPGPLKITAGYREPPRVLSGHRCLRLADGRVAVVSVGRGSGQLILQASWTSSEPVLDSLCRREDVVLLLRDGRVVLRSFDARGTGLERPYNDFTEGGVGFEAKGGSRLAEVVGREYAIVCVMGGGEVRCPRDMKAIYGELEAYGPLRNLYAQGRAALLEDGRFVLGGPGRRSNQILLDRVVRVSVADFGFNNIVGCLVRDDASVWCWGRNDFGQLGDGTRERHDNPVRVVGLPRVVDVSTSGEHACAIDEEGDVWCWGRSKDGETGEAGKEATEKREVCPIDEAATEQAREEAAANPPCESPAKPGPLVEEANRVRRVDDPCGRLGWTPERARQNVTPIRKRVPGCVMPEDLHEGHPVPVKIDEIKDAVAIEAMPERTWAVRRDGVIVMWGADAKDGAPRMQAFPVVNGAAASPSSR
ncbi:RCC1 domain-containing protein [Polyangium fumosum]|nr:RCC1 domain-containing protein [Polyangium fumosum]